MRNWAIGLVSAFAVVAAGTVWATDFGNEPYPATHAVVESWVETALYNYQTLITGILALVAAGLTIMQMRKSDKEANGRHERARDDALDNEKAAQRRHVQLFDLSLRRDARLVDRAVNPQLEDLRKVAQEVGTIFAAVTSLFDQGGYFAGHKAEMDKTVGLVVEIIERPQVKEAEALFDGKMIFARDQILAAKARYDRSSVPPDNMPMTADWGVCVMRYPTSTSTLEVSIPVWIACSSSIIPSRWIVARRRGDLVKSVEDTRSCRNITSVGLDGW
ncbi:hypothetical protein HB780_06140 (plasmid) [Rhizobium lusitanum]|uniref:hypothetical protein n=1 Tax=Rhizobium lusitanum TaxID=293958 RepID=UPI00160B3C58|nr:hypothetical protein [Rhizobium lusitanum]QND45326.1 hypothetical protein HB780_06140 [Rhizobium lusitanum]